MDVNTRTRYDQYDLSVREKVQFFLCGYAAGFFLMMVFYKDLLIAAAGGRRARPQSVPLWKAVRFLS